MKKRTVLLVLAFLPVLAAGCGQVTREADKPETEKTEQQAIEETQEQEESPEEKLAQNEKAVLEESDGDEASSGEFSFADVADREFYFSSGAGGWYTVLYIHEDGSFDGHYEDSNLGVTGEGYPNGTLYYSDFTGQFTEPEKVDDMTYRFRIESVEYLQKGEEKIKDGVLYCYGGAYGLEEAEDLYLYLPGSEIARLPEGYRSWGGYYDLESTEETELPFYGLYDEKSEAGFSSYVQEDGLSETADWA